MFHRVSLRFSCLWNPGVCPANRRDPLLAGLLASGPFLKDKLLALVEPYPDGRTGSLAARGASLVHVQQIL
jgi:hypothetical protein